MKVYRARPRAIEPSHVDEYYWDSGQRSMTVHEEEAPRDTGLLDQRGNPIMSCNIIGPIGFNR